MPEQEDTYLTSGITKRSEEERSKSLRYIRQLFPAATSTLDSLIGASIVRVD